MKKPFCFALFIGLLSACAPQNRFIGTWDGSITRPYGRVTASCTFTQAYVTCKKSDDSGFGGAYTVKTDTEAVAPEAAFDFNLLPDGSMTFNNGSFTMTLRRAPQQ
jgi:hypothetical protein